MSSSKASKPEQHFEATRRTVVVAGKPRPVLRLGKRLFVGELLSLLNPHGFGGRVWSATTLDRLQFNVDQTGGRSGTSH